MHSPTMHSPTIRPLNGAGEYPVLVRIWSTAVEATHDFLAESDYEGIKALLASDYFPSVTLSVAEIDGEAVGFSGTLNGSLEMLFVDAAHRGRGVGTALLAHAIAEHGVTSVEVNEQNVSAVAFYAHRGFEVIGRSETDEAGRPYPLLCLQLAPAQDDENRAG